MHGAGSTTADITDEGSFERSWNIAEAVIMSVLALIVAGGLAGAFGGGPLAQAEVRAPEHDVAVAYDRIVRKSAASSVAIRLDASGPVTEVAIDPDLARDVTTTAPRALAVTARGDGSGFSFATEPGQRVAIVLFLKPQSAGFYDHRLKVGDASLALTQAVLP